jgi:uncharacterized protein (UPF0332 family)
MFNELTVITANLRLHKARKDYNTAKILLDKAFYGAANDRAYFCMRHAIGAACAVIDKDLKDISSVMDCFYKNIIDECYLDEKYYKMIEAAKQSREDCIFNDCHIETKDEARQNVENANSLLEAMEIFLARCVKREYKPTENVDTVPNNAK